MDYYAVLPISNLSTKPIVIYDANQCDVGNVRRIYTSTLNKILQQIPLIDHLTKKVHMDGEDGQTTIQIRERSFKNNLIRLKWDVIVTNCGVEQKYFLESRTKIRRNPRMVYDKNGQQFLFRKNFLNRTCEVVVQNDVCATIHIEKKIPMTLKISIQENALQVSELLSIYYCMQLVDHE